MNIFRIFFVSTVLIPVLVVVATSDESGIRIRKPRSILVSEGKPKNDGTRTERRHNPVNISDRGCPSLGCTGNLTGNEYNGKGSLASTLITRVGDEISSGKERRLDSNLTSVLHSGYRHPLKLDIKTIKNSTRTDLVEYLVANDEVEAGRGLITYAILMSWAFFWTWRIIITIIIIYTLNYAWTYMRRTYGLSNDAVEYYVKLGQDKKHPFHSLGNNGWLPAHSFGISLKSKIEDDHHGWNAKAPLGWNVDWAPHKGWSGYAPAPTGWSGEMPEGWSGWAASYPDHYHQPSPYHPDEDFGWPEPPRKGWKKSKADEIEEELRPSRHKFDRTKGYKLAQKHTKKYGKKAAKYGLRPAKWAYDFDKTGNLNIGDKFDFGYAWRSLLESPKKSNATEEDSE